MLQFLLMLLSCLRSRAHFEAVQAYLALFLKTHADAVIQSPDMRQALEQIQKEQRDVWEELDQNLLACSTLVAFFKNAAIG